MPSVEDRIAEAAPLRRGGRADVEAALGLLDGARERTAALDDWPDQRRAVDRARELLRGMLAESPSSTERVEGFVLSHEGHAALTRSFAAGLADAGALHQLVNTLGPACPDPGCGHEHCALVRRAAERQARAVGGAVAG